VVIQVRLEQKEKSLLFSLAPRDERDTLFSLAISLTPEGYLAQGSFLAAAERDKMQALLAAWLGKNKVVWDLKADILGFGVVAVPCADLYVAPRPERGDNLSSQFLYGTPVVLFETTADRKFFRVQNEDDGYLGWLAVEDFTSLSAQNWKSWSDMPKIYLQMGLPNTGIHAGTALGVLQGGELWKFPSGEKISIPGSFYLAKGFKASRQSILETARRFLPEGDLGTREYLWGGTCVPYLDCSGFVQTVFRLNGILLPRDADQQHQFSDPVAPEAMQPADIVVFSKRRDRATHIGIYLGDGKYLHSSSAGPHSGVKMSDLNGTATYDRYLKSIFFGAGRILR
jgi:hypothetical protein